MSTQPADRGADSGAMTPWYARRKRVGEAVPRAWRLVLVAITAIGGGGYCVFQLALARSGLRVFDLWGGGYLRPIPPAAAEYAAIGMTVADVCCALAGAGVLAAIAVSIVALHRRDLPALGWGVFAAFSALVLGYLALDLGFIIAGI